MSTFAGTGQNATSNGVGVNAGFTEVGAVTAVGGFVYVATGNAIRKVDPSSGAVSILTGSASTNFGCIPRIDPSMVYMGYGSGMTTDGSFLYVADSRCYTVWKISLSTGATQALGDSGFSFNAGTTSGLWEGITYANSVLYAVDGHSHAVYQIDPVTGVISTAFTLPGVGTTVYGIAADDTSLWVPELNNDISGICYYTQCTDLVRITLAGGAMTTFVAASGTSETGMGQIAATQGYLYTTGLAGAALWRISEPGCTDS